MASSHTRMITDTLPTNQQPSNAAHISRKSEVRARSLLNPPFERTCGSPNRSISPYKQSMPPKLLPNLTPKAILGSDDPSNPKKRTAAPPVGRKIKLGKCTSCVNDHKKVLPTIALTEICSASTAPGLKNVTPVTPNASCARYVCQIPVSWVVIFLNHCRVRIQFKVTTQMRLLKALH